MPNKNNSNQPTNAAEVRKQNQQSSQKGTAGANRAEFGSEFGTEFASQTNPSKTNASEVRKQNQQSAQGRTEFGSEFASQTNAQEVQKQNQQSAQKAQNRSTNNNK
ncbi:gamma-type small acid-soluble spore protein [Paenisporosarcina indica]|uniref:gamma-type small acid-soluble spore protein n=1 Tax=Paenisporosarcina indica TaxID=650093 RepID=UPI00094F4DD2|nr:gamma-type small acid-soluble spore protein [Paenisporosarcina indica]